MRSGEVAEREVNVQTLRYHERCGLIGLPPRSSSGYRAYPEEAVRVVPFVKRVQEARVHPRRSRRAAEAG